MASIFHTITTAVQGAVDRPEVQFAVGRKEVDRNAKPPRVVVVPVGGPITMAQDVGGQLNGSQRDRARLLRQVTLEVKCWGAGTDETAEDDLEATDKLYTDVLTAFRECFPGGVNFGSETWDTQAEGDAGNANLGERVTFEAIVDLRVLDEEKPLTTPTTVTTDVDAELPGGTETIVTITQP